MRAFVALDIPSHVLDSIVALQAGIPVGRPVPRENLHLTIAFVGEHSNEVIEGLHHELSVIDAGAFDVQLRGLDLFGRAYPSILFAGIEESPELRHLNTLVRGAMRRAGMSPPHERYRPHVTLARFGKAMPNTEQARLATFLGANSLFRLPPFPVTEYSLFRSDLSADGARYSKLAAYSLL